MNADQHTGGKAVAEARVDAYVRQLVGRFRPLTADELTWLAPLWRPGVISVARRRQGLPPPSPGLRQDGHRELPRPAAGATL